MLLCVDHAKAQIRDFRLGDKKLFNRNDTIEMAKETYLRPDWKKVDINFLNSYYAQDGNNGAVTGGIGTEQLTDFTQKLTINFPTSEQLRWNIDAAYDYYSSASTDNIDNIQSSDSASDVRAQFAIGLEKSIDDQRSAGLRLATSVEYDYTSFSGGVNYSLLSKSRNTRIDFNAQAYYDLWMLIYPQELRGKVQLQNNKRQSYNVALGINQVINKRMQAAIMLEATYMNGLLSTPFHRVYFQNQSLPDIERLPSQRLKVPIGLRWNTHLTERLILRTYYRYYWDSWGMTGHTASIELPVKLTRFFAIYPHYRFHTQSSVDYFGSYKSHLSTEEFYTSDFDLSALKSHNYGLGVRYSKADGLIKFKLPLLQKSYFSIESIDLKYAHYNRSTGLTGDIFSLGMKLGF